MDKSSAARRRDANPLMDDSSPSDSKARDRKTRAARGTCLVDELCRKQEPGHAATQHVDERPPTDVVAARRALRALAGADLQPAATLHLTPVLVPDEPMPAVPAAMRPGTHAGAERNPAAD